MKQSVIQVLLIYGVNSKLNLVQTHLFVLKILNGNLIFTGFQCDTILDFHCSFNRNKRNFYL